MSVVSVDAWRMCPAHEDARSSGPMLPSSSRRRAGGGGGRNIKEHAAFWRSGSKMGASALRQMLNGNAKAQRCLLTLSFDDDAQACAQAGGHSKQAQTREHRRQ